MFAKYHYLNHSHNNAANVFVCTVNDVLAGFISVLHFPHPKVKNFKTIHRLVVMPDFQGIGIGKKILNFIAEIHSKSNRVIITTTNPSLMMSLKKDKNWFLCRTGRTGRTGMKSLNRTISKNRITTSWEYVRNNVETTINA
jgi:GNAT superfamily N-acetyltransferase